MTQTPPLDPRLEPEPLVRQEEDAVPWRPVVLLMAASIAMIVVGVLWPWEIVSHLAAPPALRAGSAPHAVEPQPRMIGGQPRNAATDEVGDVGGGLQRAAPGIESLEQSLARSAPEQPSLDRFEWADRDRGTVKLPVDVAARMWLERDARERGGSR